MCTGYKPWKNTLNMWRNLEKSRLKVDKKDFKSILGWSISGLSPVFSVFNLYFVHDKHACRYNLSGASLATLVLSK